MHGPRARTGGLLWLAPCVVLAIAASQYAWNAYTVEPLTEYDGPGHAAYILTVATDRRLPGPMDGWSTFHPPLYYLVSSVVWRFLDPLGPRVLLTGLRAVSATAVLTAGLATYLVLDRLGTSMAVSVVAMSILLFVPIAQMTAVMIGNEALAWALGALALVPLLTLQRDPRNARAGALVGVLAGLALATKFTGGFVVVACAVPFARRDFDRRMFRALVATSVGVLLIAGPVYVRNFALVGTPFPMTRELEPMKSTEASQVLRARAPVDYLWVNPECLLHPSFEHFYRGPMEPERNMAMTNVWGLLHATIWYDPFGHRIPARFHRPGVLSGPALTMLGAVPAATMVLGFGLALAEAVRHRGRADDAPFVVIWLVGLSVFLAFTMKAPSAAAVKGSYLLPLAAPGAVFFARAVLWIRAGLRSAILRVSVAAVVLAAMVFTNGLVFPPQPRDLMVARWRMVGDLLSHSYINEAIDHLVGPR